MACPVEWDAFDHQMDADFIDTASSVLLCAHDFICPLNVSGEYIQGQPVFPGSYLFDQTVDLRILIRNYRKQRAE